MAKTDDGLCQTATKLTSKPKTTTSKTTSRKASTTKHATTSSKSTSRTTTSKPKSTTKKTTTSTKEIVSTSKPTTAKSGTSTRKPTSSTRKTSSSSTKRTSSSSKRTTAKTTSKRTSTSSKPASTTPKKTTTTSRRTSTTTKRSSTTSKRSTTTSKRSTTTSKRSTTTSKRSTTIIKTPEPVKTSSSKTTTRKTTTTTSSTRLTTNPTTRTTTTTSIRTSSSNPTTKSSASSLPQTTSTSIDTVAPTLSSTSISPSTGETTTSATPSQTTSSTAITSSSTESSSSSTELPSSTSSSSSVDSETSVTPGTLTTDSLSGVSTTPSEPSSTASDVSGSISDTTATPVPTNASTTGTLSATTSYPVGVSDSTLPASSTASPSSSAPPMPTPTCPSPPPDFGGTTAGFQGLCNLRYCDPLPARDVDFSGLNGPVTRSEVETSLGLLMQTTPVTGLFQGNILANGAFGMSIQSAGLLYETTGDRRALEIALQLAENIYAIRNDPVKGQVLWDGVREPVWPTKAAYPTYAGCENGLIVSNMIAPAIYILKSPCLWNLVPSRVGNLTYPRAFSANATFKDRALALVSAGDLVFQQYFLPRFFDKTGNLIQPNDTRWNTVGDAGSTNLPGMAMAWNRRMMMLDGMMKLAIAFETSPALNLARRNAYDRLVGINIYSFLADVESVTAPNGMPAYDWDYTLNRNNTEEVKGIHALYDVLGVWQAWQRSSTLYPIADDVMQRLANTMMYIVFKGPRLFSAFIDGTSTTADPAVKYLWGQWVYYGKWIPNWYTQVAYANRANGFAGKSWFSIPLIWTRNRLYDAKLSWKGDFSSGFGVVAGTA
ncbi:hypothetical protein OIV83_003912 [Microbotryomycetes sp. JL201]|nr:hypothetical protein OIV83_003912 [Microbotryomycetes sp. JL201]